MYLHAHLKVVTGTIELIEALKEFCGEDLEVEEYHTFFDIQLSTDIDHLGCYFTENSYGSKDYGIMLYNRKDHDEDYFIPLKYIDCIYSLWKIK